LHLIRLPANVIPILRSDAQRLDVVPVTAALLEAPTDTKSEEVTETVAVELSPLHTTTGYFCSCGCQRCANDDHCMSRPHCLH
jgi:hypothetical protein